MPHAPQRRCCCHFRVPQGLGGRAHHSCRDHRPAAIVNGGFSPGLDGRAHEKRQEGGAASADGCSRGGGDVCGVVECLRCGTPGRDCCFPCPPLFLSRTRMDGTCVVVDRGSTWWGVIFLKSLSGHSRGACLGGNLFHVFESLKHVERGSHVALEYVVFVDTRQGQFGQKLETRPARRRNTTATGENPTPEEQIRTYATLPYYHDGCFPSGPLDYATYVSRSHRHLFSRFQARLGVDFIASGNAFPPIFKTHCNSAASPVRLCTFLGPLLRDITFSMMRYSVEEGARRVLFSASVDGRKCLLHSAP